MYVFIYVYVVSVLEGEVIGMRDEIGKLVFPRWGELVWLAVTR